MLGMNPYWMLAKLVLVGGLLVACITLYYRAEAADAERDMATQEAQLATAAYIQQKANAEWAAAIADDHDAFEQWVATNVATKKQEVRRVPTNPVLAECRPAVADFFAPIAAAFRGLHELEDDRARRIAEAKARVSSLPGSTEAGELRRAYAGGSYRDRGVPAGELARRHLPW